MRQGFKKYSDMRQAYFLNSTCDMAINRRQRHTTLAFLKIDRRHGDPPSRAPILDGLDGTGGSTFGTETLYHRDDALLYIAYVMLIWAAPIPADRWHCSLWP